MSERPDEDPDASPVSFPLDGTVYETRLTRKARARRPWQPVDQPRVATLIPGLIVRVLVCPGQEVRRGQGLVVLEAMKMRNEVQSPRDGTVAQVLVVAGQNVAKGAVLVELA